MKSRQRISAPASGDLFSPAEGAEEVSETIMAVSVLRAWRGFARPLNVDYNTEDAEGTEKRRCA
jgi:hypothetical protein